MGVNPREEAAVPVKIGRRGKFLGHTYQVCGRLLYEDDEGCQTREYLLFCPAEGYLWLAEEEGHYVLNRPTQQAPAGNVFALPVKHAVRWAGRGSASTRPAAWRCATSTERCPGWPRAATASPTPTSSRRRAC